MQVFSKILLYIIGKIVVFVGFPTRYCDLSIVYFFETESCTMSDAICLLFVHELNSVRPIFMTPLKQKKERKTVPFR